MAEEEKKKKKSRAPEISSGKRRRPYFFKIFFPHLSSHHLAIPPAFLKHIESDSSRTFSLKGPSRRVWNVGLIKKGNTVVLENGWMDFVADHSLAIGDFLVFRYDGNSCFKVLVFDPSACEKERAFDASPCGEGPRPHSKSNGEGISVAQVASRKKRRRHDCRTTDEIPKKKLDCFNECKPEKSTTSFDCSMSKNFEDDTVKTHGGCPEAADLAMPARSSMMRREKSEAWIPPLLGKTCCRTSEEKEGTIRADSKGIRKGPVEDHSDYLKSMEDCRTQNQRWKGGINLFESRRMRLGGPLTSQRRPVTVEEMQRTLKMAKSFKSRNPFAMVVMQDTYVYRSFNMNLPRPFVKEHCPNVSSRMVIWDPDRKPWTVTCVIDLRSNGYHGRLRGGWKKFSYANNLEKGDVCIFELIRTNQMQVHIFRVVEQLTPLIRKHSQGRKHHCRFMRGYSSED